MKTTISIRLILIGLFHLDPASCAPMYGAIRGISETYDGVKGGNAAGDVGKAAGGATHVDGLAGGGDATGTRVAFTGSSGQTSSHPGGLLNLNGGKNTADSKLPPPQETVVPPKEPAQKSTGKLSSFLPTKLFTPKPKPNPTDTEFIKPKPRRIPYTKKELKKKYRKKPLIKPYVKQGPMKSAFDGYRKPQPRKSRKVAIEKKLLAKQKFKVRKLRPIEETQEIEDEITVDSKMKAYFRKFTTDNMLKFLAQRGPPDIKEWARRDDVIATALNPSYEKKWITQHMGKWQKALDTPPVRFTDRVSKAWMTMWGNKRPQTRLAIQKILSIPASPFAKLLKAHSKYMDKVAERTSYDFVNWIKAHGNDDLRKLVPDFKPPVRPS